MSIPRGATYVLAVMSFAVGVAGCGAKAGSTAQDAPYEARLDDGTTVDTETLRGSPAILSSWATWCAECKNELPSLERLWQARRADGLQVVAVNLDGHGIDRRVDAMISDFKLTMPIWRDPDNTFASAYSAVGVPTTVLLDARGTVIRTWIGATDFQDPAVEKEVSAALETGS